jgi:hypothetical protein
MNSVIRIHLEGNMQVLVSESVMNVVQEICSRFQGNQIHISAGVSCSHLVNTQDKQLKDSY